MLSWPFKDPDEILDYEIDWAGSVAIPGRTFGDPLTSSTWIVPAGIIQETDSFTDDVTIIWLSGGTVGTVYVLTNRVETLGGRTMDQSVKIKIKTK